jgi:hypothetical protein
VKSAKAGFSKLLIAAKKFTLLLDRWSGLSETILM